MASLQPFAIYANAGQSVIVLVALLVCLIPTTIGGLLSAIGIAGMDRLVQRNVLAMSGRAVEAAGDVSTLLLDKTGTITIGNRHATELITGARRDRAASSPRRRCSASLADETPEGRSIVDLCVTEYGIAPVEPADAELVPFSAETRMSGVDLARLRPRDPQGRGRRGAALRRRPGRLRSRPSSPSSSSRSPGRAAPRSSSPTAPASSA